MFLFYKLLTSLINISRIPFAYVLHSPGLELFIMLKQRIQALERCTISYSKWCFDRIHSEIFV